MRKDKNIIVYPTSYNKRGPEHLHSAQGLLYDGTVVNIKLRIDENLAMPSDNMSIAEFSRTDAKASNYCIASPDNGPSGKREGILLFGDARFEGFTDDVETYVAKWGVVIARKSEDEDPIIGVSRISVNKDGPIIRQIQRELSRSVNLPEDKIERIKRELLNPQNYSFSVIKYLYEDIVSLEISKLKESLIVLASKFSPIALNGTIPGVMIRVRGSHNCIIDSSCEEIFAKYIANEERYESMYEVFENGVRGKVNEFLSRYDESFVVELMPLYKIDATKKFCRSFGSKVPFGSILSLYYKSNSKDFDYHRAIVCRGACIVSRSEDLLRPRRVYSLSRKVGSPCKLNSSGEATEVLESEFNSVSGSLDSIDLHKIGLQTNTFCIYPEDTKKEPAQLNSEAGQKSNNKELPPNSNKAEHTSNNKDELSNSCYINKHSSSQDNKSIVPESTEENITDSDTANTKPNETNSVDEINHNNSVDNKSKKIQDEENNPSYYRDNEPIIPESAEETLPDSDAANTRPNEPTSVDDFNHKKSSDNTGENIQEESTSPDIAKDTLSKKGDSSGSVEANFILQRIDEASQKSHIESTDKEDENISDDKNIKVELVEPDPVENIKKTGIAAFLRG